MIKQLEKESDIVGKVVEVNPPFWTYSYVFWVIILSSGITIMLSGVVVLVLSRRKKGKS